LVARLQREEPVVLGRTVLLMSHARTSAAHRPALTRRSGAPQRTAGQGASRAAAAIRWDRVTRVVLMFAAVLIVYLAIGPLIGLFETMQESGQRKEQLQQLEQQNQVLRERKNALGDPATLEREARRLGKIRPGERPYMVDGLPQN
jgi:cell division protein FtsB